jgi:hypothetical protein
MLHTYMYGQGEADMFIFGLQDYLSVHAPCASVTRTPIGIIQLLQANPL